MVDQIFILGSLVLSFAITFLMMPHGIMLLKKYKIGKQIREEALIGKAKEFFLLHGAKTGTPTMGAIMILLSVLVLVLLSILAQNLAPWMDSILGFSFKYSLWNRNETYIVLFTFFSVGIIGLVDDYLNVREIGRTKGLSARVKMTLLIIFGLVGAYWFYVKLGYSTVHIPFLGGVDIGWFYIPLFVFVLVATANSVNFTDGLDGLAGGLLLFSYTIYGFISYSKGLFILTAFCLIIVGALIAFLWFNIRPAQVFMGDVGSLSLGATLAVIAFMTDTLLVLVIASGIFIFEALSVIIQLLSKKFRNGKKVFRIAPFHHHLEAIGWKEETIVMRLWLIGMILAVVALTFGLIR
ncbi:MAG: phospho-N-acetylmuramoyl-pentapeptide-transferase [Candidatus Gracilibacteria bacterium]|nr:phospho-N-acetylmuramoyl-pentapeptide-transferase [Candidatus Gracilibacteria bacterium]